MIPSAVSPLGEPEAQTPNSRRLDRVRRVANLLDEAFVVPGTEFSVGLDPLLGILPGVGDLAPTAASLYVVYEGIRMGVPAGTVAKMLAVVAVDLVAGSVPLVGPLFDALWKANARNVRTLQRHVEESAT